MMKTMLGDDEFGAANKHSRPDASAAAPTPPLLRTARRVISLAATRILVKTALFGMES
jgi:hypothetical protein